MIERVILIGIDGGGTFHTTHPQLAPNIVGFLQSGSHCNFARAEYPSNSGENWGSMLTGVTPAKHGVTNENINQTYAENSEFPSIFKIITNARPSAKLASLVSWPPINGGLIEPSLSVFKYADADDELVPYITNIFLPVNGQNTMFLFIQLSDVDYAGHAYGWESQEYMDQYKKTDAHFKRILDSIEENGLSSSTLVVVTADHGGLNQTHGGDSFPETHVLLGMRGPGVAQQEFPQDLVGNMDVPAVVLSVLGLPVPPHFDGKVIPIFNH